MYVPQAQPVSLFSETEKLFKVNTWREEENSLRSGSEAYS